MKKIFKSVLCYLDPRAPLKYALQETTLNLRDPQGHVFKGPLKGPSSTPHVKTFQRRNADLEKLKAMGGPFSSSAEVKVFATSDLPEKEKVARLYLEVRLARDSCVSFPKNSDIFRLKRNYKNLDSASYCDNLVVFFDKITFRNSVTMEDFDSALNALY